MWKAHRDAPCIAQVAGNDSGERDHHPGRGRDGPGRNGRGTEHAQRGCPGPRGPAFGGQIWDPRSGPPRDSTPRPHTKATDPLDLVPPETPSAETQSAEPTTAAVPDDPVAEEAPVLMRVDDQPATAAAAEDSQTPEASGAADPHRPYDIVTVFYATDRRPLEQEASTRVLAGDWFPAAAGIVVTLLLVVAGVFGGQRRRMFGLAALVLSLTVGWGFYAGRKNLERFRTAAQSGVRYGNQRGELQVGTCRVSIPWTHAVGQIERPSLLRLEVHEDVRKHVVLHETNRQEDNEFYQQLRDQVLAAPRPEVFVFVHGYNVTFEGAARRTAQIAFDVEFAGAPVFFSWPSQGGLLKYTVDENNVEWAVPHLKQFLLEVTRRSGAEREPDRAQHGEPSTDGGLAGAAVAVGRGIGALQSDHLGRAGHRCGDLPPRFGPGAGEIGRTSDSLRLVERPGPGRLQTGPRLCAGR